MNIREAVVAANRSICVLLSPGAACRRHQAAGDMRETERARELCKFSKIILFHFMMGPRVK